MNLPDYLELRASSHSKWGEADTVNALHRAANRIRKLETQLRNLKNTKRDKESSDAS